MVYNNQRKQLMKEKKLWLILDLDLTIVHSIYIEGDLPSGYKKEIESHQDMFIFKPKNLNGYYIIKFRPQIRDFLIHISNKYEIYIYTAGTKDYACYIITLINKYILEGLSPIEKYNIIGCKILTRDDTQGIIYNLIKLLINFSHSFFFLFFKK